MGAKSNVHFNDNEMKKVYNSLHSALKKLNEDVVLVPETPELKADIWMAVHSGIKEMFDLAAMLVYGRISRAYDHITNQEYIDYENESDPDSGLGNDPLYRIITQNIRDYNGEISLSEYFDPIIAAAYPDKLKTDEQVELYNQLIEVTENLNRDNPRGADTDDVKHMIYRAVHSDNKLLFDIAALLAYEIVKPHYANMAKKYKERSCDIEDFTGATLYLAIHRNIKNYDGIHGLQTYYEPFVKAAFMKERNAGRGGMTKHYMDCSVIIARAEADLKAKGIEDIPAYMLSDYIKQHMGKSISETTILRVKDFQKTPDSIDGFTHPIADPYTTDPEKKLMEDEKKEMVHKTIEKLTHRHRIVIENFLEYVEQHGDMPSMSARQEICMKLFNNLTKEEAKRLAVSAINEMKNSYRRYSPEETPINDMHFAVDPNVAKMEEEDIFLAFEEDADGLFGVSEDMTCGGTISVIDFDDFED